MKRRRAFTLIELLVVIGIIAILAAILFPVFARAKAAAKKANCLSNLHEIGMAVQMYTSDNTDQYPQTKRTSADPAVDDANGIFDDPDYASVFHQLYPYVTGQMASTKNPNRIYACPGDMRPFDPQCESINEQLPSDPPVITSYLINGYFVFGLQDTAVPAPASTILLAERRSMAAEGVVQFCDYMYHPWFNPSNPQAPNNDMDPLTGAISTQRHDGRSNYLFADGHAKTLAWGQTYSPPDINLHDLSP